MAIWKSNVSRHCNNTSIYKVLRTRDDDIVNQSIVARLSSSSVLRNIRPKKAED